MENYDESPTGDLQKVAASLADREDIFNNKVRRQVVKFLAGDDDNIRTIATAMRHLVAHGEFTPSGSGVMTKKGTAAIQRLGDRLLSDAESRFAAWCGQLMAAS